MPIFFRIYNDKLFPINEVETLGFNITDPSYIPTEYLERQEFVIIRTCFGIGDWGILSAMPRMLKKKYPNCKVYLPSDKLLDTIFGPEFKNQWGTWANPYDNMRYVFDNNPYVDGYVDSVAGEVYNDHFRLAIKEEEPLVRQMLRFWQFSEDEMEDAELFPELYFTEEEEKFGRDIIDEYGGNLGFFGTLLVSDRFINDANSNAKIQTILDNYKDLPYFYWLTTPDISLEFKRGLNLRHIHPRVQLYLKTMAFVNIGNQSGMNDTIAQYATTYSIVRDKDGRLGTNIVTCQRYVK